MATGKRVHVIFVVLQKDRWARRPAGQARRLSYPFPKASI
jgi:hypothetical protein